MLLPLFALVACPQPNPEPELTLVEPALSCAAGSLHVDAEGVGPVVLEPLAEEPGLLWPELLVEGDESWYLGEPAWSEEGVDVLLPALEPGSWDLVLRDAFGHESRMGFGVTGRPALSGVQPESLCAELGDQEVLLTGRFAVATDALPTVRVGGREQQVLAAEQCEEGEPVALCGALRVRLEASALALGLVDIEVEGPVDDCVSEETLRVQVLAAPRITAIQDREVCDGGGVVRIEGEGFHEDMQAFVDGQPAAMTFLDGGHVEVEVPASDVGSYSLELLHPNGCSAWDEEGVRVASAPVMFFVDPPVLWDGLQMQQVTAYIADVSDLIEDVWVGTDTGEVEVDWSWDPEEPGRLYATVPSQALGVGTYELGFSQGGDCAGESSGSFEVSSGIGLSLLSVEPAQAWTFDRTPIQIEAAGLLEETPRVFLVNRVTGATTSLMGVHLLSPQSLTATVPDGLEVGFYHLLVYNPDDRMGRILKAVEVTDQPPPSIESVRPATLPRGAGEQFQVVGSDFRDATVTLGCQDGSTLATTVLSETPARLTVSANTNSLSPTVCVVTMDNADGSRARFSSVSVTNPSQNLFPWSEGPELVEARRGPAAVALRANSLNRYVVVMGGDQGDASTASNTMEVATVGVYGQLGDFAMLPGELPGVRTLAQAVVIGPYVYLIGGENSVQSVASTYRARILDPLDIPVFQSLSLRSGAGLEQGRWIYRVAALYPSDDEYNPGGESLPSDPFTLVLPEDGIQPTLTWSAMVGASGYRLYRSPAVDGSPGEEEWLADVTTTTFTDTGGATDGSVTPLPVGSVGNWAQLDFMNASRAGACVTTVPDPSPDPEVVWIIVAGGKDGNGNPQGTIEVMEVRVEGPRTQVAGNWQQLSETLSEPTWACGAWSLDYRWHSVVEPGDSWYYVGGGHGSQGLVSTIDAWSIGGTALLTDHTTVDQMSPPRAGFAAGSGSNFLYALGGQQGQPSDRGVSAEIKTPPDFKNWNSLAESLVVERYLPGIAQQSSLFVLVGGDTDDGPTTRTEVTNY